MSQNRFANAARAEKGDPTVSLELDLDLLDLVAAANDKRVGQRDVVTGGEVVSEGFGFGKFKVAEAQTVSVRPI